MKLLLDQNLSHRLLSSLEPDFSGSAQVKLLGLAEASDSDIWFFAREQEFTIVTKDADFAEISLLRGCPPKIIWLNCGNVSNAVTLKRLLENRDAIHHFLGTTTEGVLEIE